MDVSRFRPQFRSKLYSPEEVEAIPRFSFREARRHKGPIYEVLITELYEDGCLDCAYHFKCLMAKEKSLLENNFIHTYVREDLTLLMALYENGKLAESAIKSGQCDAMLRGLKVLMQTLLMLNAYEAKYQWLVKSVYKIVVRIAEKYGLNDPKCTELVSKIFCCYAENHAKDNDKTAECINYYRKALDLCRGQCWETDNLAPGIRRRPLQDFVAEELAARLIKAAIAIESSNPEKGIEMGQQAIITLATVNRPEMRFLLCKAILVITRLLLHQNRFKEAYDHVVMAEMRLRNQIFQKYVQLIAELHLYKGLCMQNFKNFPKALLKYKQSLLLSRKYGLRKIEALALLNIGKLCMQFPDGKSKAHDALCQARDIFQELNQMYHKKCSVYFLAQIQSRRHFKQFMSILKGCDENFCSLYILRKWKDQCRPFWTLENRATVYTLNTDLLSELDDSMSVGLTSNESFISVVTTRTYAQRATMQLSHLGVSLHTNFLNDYCLLLEEKVYHESLVPEGTEEDTAKKLESSPLSSSPSSSTKNLSKASDADK